MRDTRARRIGGARTTVAVVAMLTAVAPPLVAVAPAVAAAPTTVAPVAESAPDGGGLSVSAAMTVGAGPSRAGDEVTVQIVLTNTGTGSLPVAVDEVFGDVLDDAVLRNDPRSSDPELLLMRLGYDRLAIMGELGAGERATVEYTVVVGPVDDRGDGVLRRVLVPADEAATCGDGVLPSESAVLGSCTGIAAVDGPKMSVTSSERAERVADAGASGGTADGGASAGAITANGAAPAAEEDSVAGSHTLVLIAAAALSLLLLGAALVVALIRRSRAARPAVRRASARPAAPVRVPVVGVPVVGVAPVPVASVRVPPVRGSGEEPSPASAPRAASIGHGRRVAPPVMTAPHFDSRRERRLAERRLVERGLALPVA